MGKKMLMTAIGVGMFVSVGAASGKAEWGYEGDIGPDRWGDLSSAFRLCKTGKSQSPIDIRGAKKEKLPSIDFNYKESKLTVVNNGHTIKVKYEGGSYINHGGRTCELLQFHFHSPSEHLINGNKYPMEAHLVHKCDDGKLLVIGVMIEEGEEHPLIEGIWSVMPEEAGKTVKTDKKINAEDLLPENRSYYTYSGSLTTPPCSEGVTWIVMKESIEVSPAQIKKFKALYRMNARPAQPLNGRVIRESY